MNAKPVERIAEQKHVFSLPAADCVCAWLEHTCVPDPEYADDHVYSFYYDTRDLSAYHDNLEGSTVRTKYRLRWYGSSVQGDATSLVRCFLEVKEKVGGKRVKPRWETRLSEGMLAGDALQNPENRWALSDVLLSSPFAPREHVVPAVVIGYRRRRYIEPESGSRVAVDTDITCLSINDELLYGQAPVSLTVGVLEVKGVSMRTPAALQPVSSMLERTSFSKYVHCVDAAQNMVTKGII